MNPEQFRRSNEVFTAACALPVDERAEYVRLTLADDAEVRDAVLQMLEYDRGVRVDVDGALGASVRAMAEGLFTTATRSDLPERIGAYRILGLLGEGGFGVVYRAEQESPRRVVALKVLRTAIATPAVRRRFEYESQILGRLQHPGIAQVFEAGVAASPAGTLPYFAMELIDGRSVIEFAESTNGHREPLDLRSRLELFERVCAPIEYAHRQGIVHRDLKPENILVDGNGLPRILDFGVARLMDSEQMTRQTSQGQLIGTLAYMSPEQISGDAARIDTRTDVYSLGVVLYRLLSGRLPFDLTGRSLADAISFIRNGPPRALGSIDRRLRGDVDAIVARAMETDPERRYPSVGHFSSDIRAFLEGRSISVRHASAIYRIRKFAARHRSLVIATGVTFVALLAGTITTTWQAIAAMRERDAARVAATKTDRINQFLRNMLGSLDPDRRGGRYGVQELLDQAEKRAGTEFADAPDLEADVRATLGETYAGLGRFEPAERNLRTALDIYRRLPDDQRLEIANASIALAHVYRELGRVAEGREMCGPAVATLRELRGKQSAQYVRALMLHADLLAGDGTDYAGAEHEYREALEILTNLGREELGDKAKVLGNLGALLYTEFRFDDAESVQREAFTLAKEIRGSDSPVFIINGNNFAMLLLERGKTKEARDVAMQTVASAEGVFGEEHPETGRSLFQAADCAIIAGDAVNAELYARRALAARRKTLPEDHLLRLSTKVLVARALLMKSTREAAEEALQLTEDAIERLERQKMGQHWWCAEAHSVHAAALAALDLKNAAEPELISSYESLKTARGVRGRPTREALARLVAYYEQNGDTDAAANLREQLRESDPRAR